MGIGRKFTTARFRLIIPKNKIRAKGSSAAEKVCDAISIGPPKLSVDILPLIRLARF